MSSLLITARTCEGTRPLHNRANSNDQPSSRSGEESHSNLHEHVSPAMLKSGLRKVLPSPGLSCDALSASPLSLRRPRQEFTPSMRRPFMTQTARPLHTTNHASISKTSQRPQGVTEGIDTPIEPNRRLSLSTINPNVVRAKYAVRGELAIRAEKYRVALENAQRKADSSSSDLPFDSVIFANIGNPQQLDQKPITFFRQVLSILENPALLALRDTPAVAQKFGYLPDVFDRAERLLKDVGSVGAYSQSAGIPCARKSVARYLEQRDGCPANPDDIFLTAGASAGVNTLLNVICHGPQTGVLIPIPQYPLYTATLAILNAEAVPYYLDEDAGWATNVDAIEKSLQGARDKGVDVRAIAVINPGNPTGSSLSADSIKRVLDVAARQRLVVIADEVYQTNVFTADEGEIDNSVPFTSFKKVLRTMQSEHPDGRYNAIELVSLHSISKGMVGECGHRGGYFELIGFHPAVREQIYKFISVGLCPPVIGQCLVEMMVNPPKQGDPSYPLYAREYDGVKNRMKQRAMALYSAFNEMEGVSCAPPTGSMYLYPRLTLPRKAIEAAKQAGLQPDEFYCGKLLDATGICVVPGSGFGQAEGTFHLRTTFLAPGTEWVGRIVEFHKKFCKEFGDA